MNDIRIIEGQNETSFHSGNRSFQEKVEYEMINEEETDQFDDQISFQERSKYFQKQGSISSTASGDYEEITLAEGEFENEYKSLVDTPPPLPPRKSNASSSSK